MEEEVLDEYLEGYRVWRFNFHNNRLYSLMRLIQYPRGVATAKCLWQDKHPHDIPNSQCKCGYYAHWTKDQISRVDFPVLSGKVLGWGKALLASGGWRSQYQMLDELYMPLCQACCALLRWGSYTDIKQIQPASIFIEYRITLLYDSNAPDAEDFLLDLDEFVCTTHAKEMKAHNKDLLTKMVTNLDYPPSELDKIVIKATTTQDKYLPMLRDAANYYEVDLKEWTL